MGGAAKALSARVEDKLGRSVGILFGRIVPKADDRPTLAFKKCRAAPVVSRGIGMLTSVQLNRELRFTAGEIDDKLANNQLAREPGPVMPQPQPQQPLCFC